MINIKDFCDMEQFEQIMSNWAKATGLATVAVGADGIKFLICQKVFLNVFSIYKIHFC